MKKQFLFPVLAALFSLPLKTLAQFAPPVGQPGTTAVYKDSSIIVSWASHCQVVRGLQDISMPSAGYANVGDSTDAVGAVGINGVVSLGDGGSAVLRFATPLLDGPGLDFAVFENGFDDTFLELAFVEVSSDGLNFFRFPALSNTDTTVQTGSFGSTDATKINNLAGKYRGEYGTPFDLSDIPDHQFLDKQAITHVKVIDVIGCIQDQYCTRDAAHHKINDPWPTGFGAGGFDLDAVGVINQQSVSVREFQRPLAMVFPNPVSDVLYIQNSSDAVYSFSICDLPGKIIVDSKAQSHLSVINLSALEKGIYLLTIVNGAQKQQCKLIKN